jgi:hypothetical protein
MEKFHVSGGHGERRVKLAPQPGLLAIRVLLAGDAE